MNLAVLASIVSQIGNAVTVAEAIFPKLSGSEKFSKVLTKVHEIIDGAPLLVEEAEKIKAQAKPIIDGFVAVMNETGLFRKGQEADKKSEPVALVPAAAVTSGVAQEGTAAFAGQAQSTGPA